MRSLRQPRRGSPDRALRALSRQEPALLIGLVRLLIPRALPPDVAVRRAHVDDPHLPLPGRERILDSLIRVGSEHLLQTEFQSYPEPVFPQRLFDYHVLCIAHYPGLTVVTVAIWLLRPPPEQIPNEVCSGHVRIKVWSIVLPDVAAEVLLAHPGLACFAIGANRGDWSVRELCERVLETMIREKASLRAWRAACAIAVARGRYTTWEKVMREANVESNLLPEEREMYEEYYYQKGRRTGRRTGRALGREQGLAWLQQALLTTYRARFNRVPVTIRRAVEAQPAPEALLRWQAAFCKRTAAEIAALVQARAQGGRAGASDGGRRRMGRG